MRRIVTILLVMVIVIGGSLFALRITAQEREPPEPDYDVLRVERGNMVSTVSATGTIEPEQDVSLVFKGTGRVAEVLAEEGEFVQAGDLLARLETEDLELAEAQAEVSLAISQAQLAKLSQEPSQTEIRAAEAAIESAQAAVTSAREAVASAQASYSDLLAGPTEDERRAAVANVERARAVLKQAQASYDEVAHLPNVAMLPQAVQLQQATIDLEAAEANYRITTSPAKASQVAAASAQVAQAQASVAQSEASVAQAQSNLDKLLEGASEEDLAIAEAQVTQAELSLQQARLARENSELRSPIDGTLTQLNVKPGELPNAALPAAIVTDLDRFHIDVEVDEIDISRLSEGQPVNVLLDALPEAEIAGHIGRISPTPLQGAVVSYLVRVFIDESNAPLRSGLSATATVITEELEDILLVPNRSIQIDRTSGRAFVEKIVDGVPTRTEIALGSRNEQQSQVLDGLEAGDELAIRAGTGLDRLRSTFFGQ